MSKYVQSDLGDTFKQVDKYLKVNRIVLFSGTPCQVAGLRAYINREDANLILLDLVCHGVPSPKLFEDYKAALSEKYESDIQNIYFRSKILGHHLSTIAVRFSNGKLIHSRRLVKSYPRLWFAGFASRPSCYACSFKEEDRVSDFTLFDSFKSAGQYGFKDDDMGLSNVYVRTQKAIDLWKQIETQVTAVKTETAVTNKNDGDMIYESAVKNKARAEFWSDYGKLSYTELIDKYIPYSKKEAIMDKVKRVMVSTGLSKNLKIKKLLTTITDLNFYVIDNQYITSWYDSGFVFLILCVFICVHFIIELTKIIVDKHIEISLRKKSLVLLIGMILVMFYSFIIDVLTWYQPIFIISFIIALSNWNIKEAKKECEYTR